MNHLTGDSFGENALSAEPKGRQGTPSGRTPSPRGRKEDRGILRGERPLHGAERKTGIHSYALSAGPKGRQVRQVKQDGARWGKMGHSPRGRGFTEGMGHSPR
eukprot:9053279-Pyramimonas_sp.AAC.1